MLRRIQETQFKKNDIGSALVRYPLEQVQQSKTLEFIAQITRVSRATAEQYDAIQRKGTEEQEGVTDSAPVCTHGKSLKGVL
jgi:hypothetical protein